MQRIRRSRVLQLVPFRTDRGFRGNMATGSPLRWRCRSSRRGRAPAERNGGWAQWRVCCERPARCQRRRGSLFVEAIERFERAQTALHAVRTRLHYGEWLRRVNRRRDAREQLNIALEMFTRMGAAGFAERARRGTDRHGGRRCAEQPIGSGDELTAHEAQIARLAADGLTNQEIGAQLFISTHTVEWHMRKVFVKLGITSRRQLRAVSFAS